MVAEGQQDVVAEDVIAFPAWVYVRIVVDESCVVVGSHACLVRQVMYCIVTAVNAIEAVNISIPNGPHQHLQSCRTACHINDGTLPQYEWSTCCLCHCCCSTLPWLLAQAAAILKAEVYSIPRPEWAADTTAAAAAAAKVVVPDFVPKKGVKIETDPKVWPYAGFGAASSDYLQLLVGGLVLH